MAWGLGQFDSAQNVRDGRNMLGVILRRAMVAADMYNYMHFVCTWQEGTMPRSTLDILWNLPFPYLQTTQYLPDLPLKRIRTRSSGPRSSGNPRSLLYNA